MQSGLGIGVSVEDIATIEGEDQDGRTRGGVSTDAKNAFLMCCIRADVDIGGSRL